MMVLHLVEGARRALSRRLDGPLPLDHPSLPFVLVVPHGDGATVFDASRRPLGELRAGASLRVGGASLCLDRDEPVETERVVALRITSKLTLRIDEDRALPLEQGPLVIGRDPGCDVVLDDPSVSARHCVLSRDDGRWTARDLGSTNGLWIRGARVTEAALSAGVSLELGRLTLSVEARRDDDRDDPLVGTSSAMRALRADISRFAPAPYPVLIQGESGAGKELVARAIHQGSPRAKGPFVPVNCGALSAEVIESELFGHERGAFTGAVNRRRGLFEEAHGGTLFLDEVGELPRALQTRLLRVLETGELRRVGGEGVVRVDVRVVSATWRDLDAMVSDGAFRQDLFYRLADLRVRVPPLRARGGDIAALCDALLDRIHRETGRRCALEDQALGRLLVHPWPGNVRELLSVLKRAVFLCGGSLISARHVELASAGYSDADHGPAPRRVAERAAGEEGIDERVRALLERFGGNVSRVSKVTGLARSTVRARAGMTGPRSPRDTDVPARYDPSR